MGPTGNGRSEPNDHPQLSPPVGRFDPTQLFNPLYAVQQVLGDSVPDIDSKDDEPVVPNSLA